MVKSKREVLWNIPNLLSLIRVIITFIVVYLIVIRANIWYIIIVFSIGMITDFFDGKIARDTKQKTETGRNLDIIADRIFYITIMIVIFIEFLRSGLLSPISMLQLCMVMTREAISAPFAIMLVALEKKLPKTRFIGKLTTFMQGITLPFILLSIFFNIFIFSIVLATATGIIGVFAAGIFIRDTIKEMRK
ncbi:MAG: CDP-alcohol phosphatidyltransferase family protein [Candidatus Pacearchaeota archaeon]